MKTDAEWAEWRAKKKALLDKRSADLTTAELVWLLRQGNSAVPEWVLLEAANRLEGS